MDLDRLHCFDVGASVIISWVIVTVDSYQQVEFVKVDDVDASMLHQTRMISIVAYFSIGMPILRFLLCIWTSQCD